MKKALTAKTERVYHRKLMWTPCARTAEVVDNQLENGQWCGSNDTPVTWWWRGLGRGWARMVQLNEGFLYFALLCFFPPRRRRRFCQEVFYGKLDGYSKYVCCISAPCVMNKYYLNQQNQTSTSKSNFDVEHQTSTFETSNHNFHINFNIRQMML